MKLLPAGAGAVRAMSTRGARALLAVRGARALTGGLSERFGPLALHDVSEAGALSLAVACALTDDSASARVTALAFAHSGAEVIAAEPLDNKVAAFSATSLEPTSLLLTAPCAVSALALSRDDQLLAIGLVNGTVLIMRRSDDGEWPTEHTLQPAGAQAVRSLAWDPLQRYLALALADGTVLVLNASASPAYAVAATPTGYKPAAAGGSPPEEEFPLCWHPTGAALAFGTASGVAVIARLSWLRLYSLEPPLAAAQQGLPPLVQGAASNACCWSPNGRYLASADINRRLFVWDATVAAANAGGAAEPALAFCGIVKDFVDASEAAEPLAMTQPQPGAVALPLAALAAPPVAITGLGWTADGHSLAVLDAEGVLNAVRADVPLRKGGSATEPVEDFAWPLHALPAASAPATAPLAAPAQAAAAAPAKEPVVAADAVSARADVEAPSVADTPAPDVADAGVASVANTAEQAPALAPAPASSQVPASALALAPALAPVPPSARPVPATAAPRAPAAATKFVDVEAAESDGAIESDGPTSPGLAAASAAAARARAMRDEGTSEADAAGVVSLTAEKHKLGFKDVDDDEGEAGAGGGLQDILDEAGPGRFAGGADVDALRRALSRQTKMVDRLWGLVQAQGLVAPQPPFQSGSTRYSGRLARRYLAWNAVGTITSRRESGVTTIDVDFTDTALHRALHFNDPHGFSMAALSEQGALYASPYVPPTADSEDGQAARLRFSSFGVGYGQASLTDWTFDFPVFDARRVASDLPLRLAAESVAASSAALGGVPLESDDDTGAEGDEGADTSLAAGGLSTEEPERDTAAAAESPLAVALGDGWAVAATDRQLLRFVRTGGSQDAVLAVAGPVVTVAARGALCAVCYHVGAPSACTQRLAVDVYFYGLLPAPLQGSTTSLSTCAPQLLRTVRVPMRPHALLQWLDFASNGMLMAHDALGQLTALLPAFNWTWAPLCDTRAAMARGKKASRDACWPISVALCPPDVVRNTAGGAGAGAGTGAGVGRSSYSAASAMSAVPSADVPVIFGVLLKGGAQHQPPVSMPRPLAMPLALHAPLLESGELGAFDDGYIRAEAFRVHRGWCEALGLSFERAGTVALHSAMTAAAALARGLDAPDARTEAQKEIRASQTAAREEERTLDKGLLRMIKAACDANRDVRAVQLACRLNGFKSLELAHQIASATSRPAVVERVTQLLIARMHAQQQQPQQQVQQFQAQLQQMHQTQEQHKQQQAQLQLQLQAQAKSAAAMATPPSASAAAQAAAPQTLPPHRSAAHDDAEDAETSSRGDGLAAPPPSAASSAPPPSSSSGAAPTNIFARKTFGSPSRAIKRDRDGLDLAAGDSPARPGPCALERQGSFAVEARAKRLRAMQQ